MNDLIIFYLMTSATQVLPFLFITFCLVYGDPTLHLQNMLAHQPVVNRRLGNIRITRWGQCFQLIDSDSSNYFVRFSFLVSGLQVIIVILITLAIKYEIPLPYIGNLNEILPAGIMYDLLNFSMTTTLIQMIPLNALFLAVLHGLPIPFMPSPRRNRALTRNEIISGEQQSQDFVSIRLTRFETPDKIYVFARCQNDNLGTGFKLVFCQRRGVDADPRTECYLYLDDAPTLQRVIPAPISINELEEIFDIGEN